MDEGEDVVIGDRVRAARERRGFSREALAFHSGISWSAIAQIESGRRTNVRPTTLKALANALSVTIDYLVSGCAATAISEHRALLYATAAEFEATVVPFLTEGLERSEALIAATSPTKIRRLRRRLGPSAARVRFVDHTTWYQTPVAALNGYTEFIDAAVSRGAPWVRIVGEPVWSGRSRTEVRLWARYEALLNICLSSSPVTTLCPYDTQKLDPGIVDHACATHPETVERGQLLPSPAYRQPSGFVLER